MVTHAAQTPLWLVGAVENNPEQKRITLLVSHKEVTAVNAIGQVNSIGPIDPMLRPHHTAGDDVLSPPREYPRILHTAPSPLPVDGARRKIARVPSRTPDYR
ncbi:MAG: hypothetical protein KGJ62_12210 [Armatimonadetes bacterium]|nr:hypothetical protein [Armatimonadota bacterium]MDE2206311.1 hypothetical protein [Armatimonadota bacterium]